jgi:hypothetical protein
MKSWRDTIKPEDVVGVPKPIQDTLDILSDLIQLEDWDDKYVYMSKLLKYAKDEGLLNSYEEDTLRTFIVGPRGWL